MDVAKVDLVLKYALCVAAREDEFRDRELGPIHLIKYVYLADLAHAEQTGETFTGVEWKFHKFGPFAQELNARIAPSVQSMGATDRTFESAFSDDDVHRFSIGHDADVSQIERNLPVGVYSAVRSAVRRFTNDTTELLHHVYLTRPMLDAAPGETLRFERAVPEPPPVTVTSLTVKQLKRRKERMASLRSQMQERLRGTTPDTESETYVPPRYDEGFAEIRGLLAEEDGGPAPDESGELTFDESVWRSQGRTATDG